jgi:hypothetical protein
VLTSSVLSDFGATHSTAPSANAGMDQELPGTYWCECMHDDGSQRRGGRRETQQKAQALSQLEMDSPTLREYDSHYTTRAPC